MLSVAAGNRILVLMFLCFFDIQTFKILEYLKYSAVLLRHRWSCLQKFLRNIFFDISVSLIFDILKSYDKNNFNTKSIFQ